MRALRIYDGREFFYQWDTAQKITSNNFNVGEEIHFYNYTQAEALVTLTYDLDGKVVADVPNILLQKSSPIFVYRMVVNDSGRVTRDEVIFDVKQRAKPSDYVYTETEVFTYHQLENRVEALEEKVDKPVDPTDIAKAVEDYLVEHPVEVPEVEIPEKLPSPYALTIGGVSYDGSEAVSVEIPSGGGGGVVEKQGMELLTTVTVAEDVTVINISQCDDGTLFEAKKLTRIGVFMTIAGNSAVTTDAPLSALAGTTHPMYGRLPIPKMISSSTKKGSIEFRTIGRQIYMDAFSDSQRYHGDSSVVNASGNFSNAFPTINNIRLFYDGSGYVIPAGSTFEVWGY